MNKSINGAILGLILFLPTYCLCFWFGIMPKFYPLLGEVHIVEPPGAHIAVKFVGSALVGIVAGIVGFLAGRSLPENSGKVLHVLVWVTMIAAGTYLIGRETVTYILH
ncbi:MAG: hypothetical protein GXY58_16680 [Planctomycetaceae bacterium]|nr:hypothetical protein [Planctomycetaceae bacterium]